MHIHAHNILAEMAEMAKLSDELGVEEPKGAEFSTIRAALSSSAKFNLGVMTPAEFSPLVTTGGLYLEEGLLPLPYPKTYFEFTETGEYGERWWGVLIHPDQEYPDGYALRVFGGGLSLLPRPYRLVIFRKDGRYHLSEYLTTQPTDAAPTCPPGAYIDYQQPIKMVQKKEKLCALIALQSGIALLSSPAVTTKIIPTPKRLNKRRLKKGKLPLFSYHVLRISGRSVSGGLIAPGNKRASPRRHWRRGHVRVYRRGETSEAKTIIPPALIGHRGFVGKDYDLSRAAASQLSPSKEP